MKIWAVASLCGALGASPLVGASAQASLLTPRDSALHALNRLAYGPRPGEVDRIAASGVMAWIDSQLDPQTLADRGLAERERGFRILDYDRTELARLHVEAQRERRARRRDTTATDAAAAQRGRRM